MQNNVAFALFYAGEFSEALKNAETLNPQPTSVIVACLAALNGSQAAFAEARRRTSGEEQFQKVAEVAGLMLANLRKYPLAADLEEAGASGENASATAAIAAEYRKTVPHEQIAFADDPAGVAMRFNLLESDPDITIDQLRAIVSRNGKTALAVPDVLNELVKQENRLLSRKARTGEFADVGLDLSLTRAQPRVQGSDSTGYKVTLWPSAGYKTSIYVVKDDGRYKVLATSSYPAGIGLEVLDRVAANDLAAARILLDWLREDYHLGGGDDPLSGEIFPRFWTKGADADAASVRLAAASILVDYEQTAAQGVAILEAGGAAAASDSEKTNILRGLLAGYADTYQYEKALTTCESLARLHPESKSVFRWQSYQLRALGRFQDADRLAEERLKGIPGDLDAMRAHVESATTSGNYAKAHALDRRIVDEGVVEAMDLNRLAWHSLFTGKVDASDIDAALKATQLSNNNPGILHTLGCVYAEVGKTREAREVLVQAMDSLSLDEPDGNYWYAFGRIAEQYGERTTALAYYARLTKPKHAIEIPESSYRLAQMRLQALQAEKR